MVLDRPFSRLYRHDVNSIGDQTAGKALTMVTRTEGPDHSGLSWHGERRGRIEVYVHAGGERVAALLELHDEGGTLLLNERLVALEGRRVAVGWALALSEMGADGYYALYKPEPQED